MIERLDAWIKAGSEERPKPCPFCGGPAELFTDDMHLHLAWLACRRCEAQGAAFLSVEEAVAAWNRRDGKP